MTTRSIRRLTFFAAGAALAIVSGCSDRSMADPVPQGSVVMAMRKVDSLSAGGGAAGGSGTGWGTLKGRFIYNGAAPAMPNIAMGGKDPLCKVPLKEETLLVDGSSKGLGNVLIYLIDAPRVHPELEAAPPKEVLFDQRECRFLTHVAVSTTKDKFAVLNTDETGHNSNGAPGNGNDPFNVLLSAKTGRFDAPKFRKALTFPYEITCSIHPWMKAYHIVRPDPYVAVTAADGTFEIPKVPAGTELEFQVWHERGAGEKGALKASADFTAKGRFKITIPKDGETVTKDVTVEPSALQ